MDDGADHSSHIPAVATTSGATFKPEQKSHRDDTFPCLKLCLTQETTSLTHTTSTQSQPHQERHSRPNKSHTAMTPSPYLKPDEQVDDPATTSTTQQPTRQPTEDRLKKSWVSRPPKRSVEHLTRVECSAEHLTRVECSAEHLTRVGKNDSLIHYKG